MTTPSTTVQLMDLVVAMDQAPVYAKHEAEQKKKSRVHLSASNDATFLLKHSTDGHNKEAKKSS